MEMNLKFTVTKPSDKKMTWDKAVQFAKEAGLHLPTKLESMVIATHKDELDFELPEVWWTNEEYSASEAWYACDCSYVNYFPKDFEDDVILVKRSDIGNTTTCSHCQENSSDKSENLIAEEMVHKLREMGYTVKCTKTITFEI